MRVCAKSLQLCETLCNPMDGSLSDFFVNEILQRRILEWVAMLSSKGSSWPSVWAFISYIPALASGFFTTSSTREVHVVRYTSINQILGVSDHCYS